MDFATLSQEQMELQRIAAQVEDEDEPKEAISMKRLRATKTRLNECCFSLFSFNCCWNLRHLMVDSKGGDFGWIPLLCHTFFGLQEAATLPSTASEGCGCQEQPMDF